MTTNPSTPFGHTIRSDDIIDALSFFDDWEERYKYIIDLGKELPPMPEALKTDERKIRGCQSQVWIDFQLRDGRMEMAVDSDAFIVKGLLGVVLAAYNHQTPEHALAFDVEQYFGQLDLLGHLSPARGNGLRAMVARIREMAAEYAAA
ncbi:MAG: SufE family protein [Halioglobus sp.]